MFVIDNYEYFRTFFWSISTFKRKRYNWLHVFKFQFLKSAVLAFTSLEYLGHFKAINCLTMQVKIFKKNWLVVPPCYFQKNETSTFVRRSNQFTMRYIVMVMIILYLSFWSKWARVENVICIAFYLPIVRNRSVNA